MGDTCETCKHWREDEDWQWGRVGECSQLIRYIQQQAGLVGISSRLLTSSHHTCDKHEQKQTNIDNTTG